jgi:transposase
MPKASDNDPKRQALRQSGTLNPRPQEVRDELFREKEFFDARDLLQVKYEMLRRVSQEGHSISQAATSFGFSRPSFYQAQSAFETSGLAGLVPQKRGPKQGHKLTPEILEFVRKARVDDAKVTTSDLVKMVQERLGVELHSRTIERGLLRDQKKRR